jgi:hypothetical protein
MTKDRVTGYSSKSVGSSEPWVVFISVILSVSALLLAQSVATAGGRDARRKPIAAAERVKVSFNGRHLRKRPYRFFSPSSVWNKSLPRDAPVDRRSAAMVASFDQEIAGPLGVNTTNYSVPIYTVPADQPSTKVTLMDPWRAPGGSALQSAWDAVPLPPNAQPAAGTDKQLVVWQPSTDRLWEFWVLNKSSTGWQAWWGGAIKNASSDPGSYGSGAWPGATRLWGATASSLSILGGLITLEDLDRGQINHALAMAIPDPRAGIYVAPAKRTDGRSTDPLSLPEGARLRLDPKLDLASLHLPRLTMMIAQAAQRYGIIIRDTAGDVTFYAQDPTPTGTEPFGGTDGYFEGTSAGRLLASFPWNRLQVLKMKQHQTQ